MLVMTRTTSRVAYKQIKEDGTTVKQSEYIQAFIDSIPPGPPMVSQEDFRKTTLEINRYNGNGQIIDITDQVQSAD